MARVKVSTELTNLIAALSNALTEATDIEQLFGIWERNVDTVRALNRQTNRPTPRGVVARNLVAQLKNRAIALAKQNAEPTSDALKGEHTRSKIDKSVLAISEPSAFAQKNTCASLHSGRASSAVAPQPTRIIFVMPNLEVSHSK